MRLDPILTKAVRLAEKGNYDSAIKTLECEVTRYDGSFSFFYLLGVFYLHAKIFGRALTYLNLAAKQKMKDTNTMLGLAAYCLNRGDTDRAVNIYLEVQSIDESNRIAKKALKIIRKNPGPENMAAWIDSGRLPELFPPVLKADITRKALVARILCAAAAVIIIFGIAVNTGLITLPSAADQRPLPPDFILAREEMTAPLQTGGVYRHEFANIDQVLSEFNEARRLFITNRDDAARVRLNRILESNAPETIKNRARLLMPYLVTPGFDTMRDRFTFSEVTNEPFFFRDCHVIWRGRAANLVIGHDYTSFDLLVGSDDLRIMEGIVHVFYDRAIPVNPERPVEILGRIIPLSADRDPRIRIEGVALNQAGLLDRM